MGFDTGSVSFKRFRVVGSKQPSLDADLLAKFAALTIPTGEETTSEIDYAWCGPRHVLDPEFTVGNCVFNDCVHVGFRVDTNKVPAEMKRAYLSLEVAAAAAGNLSGFASKKQKRDAKESAARQIDADLASGKYRRSKMVNVLWDVAAGIVYAAVGASAAEQLAELFERTHGLSLQQISAGALALGQLETIGRRRQYEDIVPTRFANSDMQPEYPWTAKGEQAKDFLGNEFLMWLWHEGGVGGGEVTIDKSTTATVMFTNTLALDCSFGISGKTSLKLEVPTEMAEAYDALRSGKVPRTARLTLALRGQLYVFTLAAETLAVNGLKLPDVEKADSPRVLFEERISLLRDFIRDLDRMYATFLAIRTGEHWQAKVAEIRKWLSAKSRVAA